MSAAGLSVGLLLLLLLTPELRAETGRDLTLTWTNRLLRISGAKLPGGHLEVLYPEAFCRSGSTSRDWGQTVFPHKTVLLSRSRDGKQLRLLTQVEPQVRMTQDIRASEDEVEFVLRLVNTGRTRIDLQWFQPACIRVDGFTGGNQTNYTERSFIFTRSGLTRLNAIKREEEARYRGGQVYVPEGIRREDVNPRPISSEQPVNGLVGCFSADNQWLLATAWDQTHELFQGVYVCLHADPHVGGLAPGETRKIRGKLYLLGNDPRELLKRYERDFGRTKRKAPPKF